MTIEALKKARVWPESDEANVPPIIIDGIRRYHRAMLAAAPKELT